VSTDLTTTEDPLVELMRQTEIRPEAADSIAAYFDLNILMAKFREHRYDASGRLDRLFVMLDDEDVKIQQWAMKKLDGIMASAMKMRGLIVRPTGSLPAATSDPIGQVRPAVRSVEMTTKSVRVTMESLQENPDVKAPSPEAEIFDAPSLPDAPDSGTPVTASGPAADTGDDDFYRDDRADNPNIWRPPTRPLGGPAGA